MTDKLKGAEITVIFFDEAKNLCDKTVQAILKKDIGTFVEFKGSQFDENGEQVDSVDKFIGEKE